MRRCVAQDLSGPANDYGSPEDAERRVLKACQFLVLPRPCASVYPAAARGAYAHLIPRRGIPIRFQGALNSIGSRGRRPLGKHLELTLKDSVIRNPQVER